MAALKEMCKNLYLSTFWLWNVYTDAEQTETSIFTDAGNSKISYLWDVNTFHIQTAGEDVYFCRHWNHNNKHFGSGLTTDTITSVCIKKK